MATQRIIDHIDTLRAKPEHVRHRIALGVAFGITGVVAAGWLAAVTTSGTLALKSEPAAANGATSDVAKAVNESTSAISSLMGAAGAAFGATSTEAALSIIDSKTSSTLDARASSANATDKTVIPF